MGSFVMWNKRIPNSLAFEPSRESTSLQSVLIDAILAFSLVLAIQVSPLIGYALSTVTRYQIVESESLINVIFCLVSVSFGMRAASKLAQRLAAQKAVLEQRKLKAGQRKLMGLSPTSASQQEAPSASHLSLPLNRASRLLFIPWVTKAPTQQGRDMIKGEEPLTAPLLSPFPPQGPAHNTIATLKQIEPFLDLLSGVTKNPLPQDVTEDFYIASEYYPQQQYSDDMSQAAPLVMLPAGSEAPTYRNSWWRQGEAWRGEARQGQVLSPTSMDIVDDFTESIIGVVWSNRLVEAWVDNLREWLSFKVLKPLVASVNKAHEDVNIILDHYQSLQQQQHQGPQGQVSPQASPLSQMSTRLPSLPDALAASEGGGTSGPEGPVSSFYALLSPTPSSPLQGQAQGHKPDLDSALRYAQGLCQSLSQQAAHQGNAVALAKALVRYSSLLSLLKGKAPSDLLPPTPPGYCWSRIQALAEGSCLPCFQWAGGGTWGLGFSQYGEGRPWTPDLPTDSALVLYLFAAFIETPGWDYPLGDIAGPSFPSQGQGQRGPGLPLFLGQLPPRASTHGQYSAILTYRPERPSDQSDAILALNMTSSVPLHCFMAQGRTVALTGYQACFHSILMFVLYHQRSYNGALGAYYLDDPALALSPVIAFQGR